MIFDRSKDKEVIALLGAGSMGTAILRRIAAGKKILLGDVLLALKYPDDAEIKLDANTIVEARRPIQRMLELSE